MLCTECGDTIAECRCDHLKKPHMFETEIGKLFVRGMMPVTIMYRVLDGIEKYYIRMPDGWILHGSSMMDLQYVIEQNFYHSRIEFYVKK